MSNEESNKLRDGIRRGVIDCIPNRGCDRNFAKHALGCPWQQAVERIYKIERELEGIS